VEIYSPGVSKRDQRRAFKKEVAKYRGKISGTIALVTIVGLVGYEAVSFSGLVGGSEAKMAVPLFEPVHPAHNWHSRSLLEEVDGSGEAGEADEHACGESDPFTAKIESCSYEKANMAGLWGALYVFIVYVIFLGIAILCDDYFLGSLEGISEALDLSEDVAGATFMAAGSSAPELFTSLAGVAMGHAETGAGTIVGSAVFNILVIIALTSLMAPGVQVDWKCITRDGTFYGISIVLFMVFSYDNRFELHEAIILLVMYMLYVIIMVFNEKLMLFLGRFDDTNSKVEPAEDDEKAPEKKKKKKLEEVAVKEVVKKEASPVAVRKSEPIITRPTKASTDSSFETQKPATDFAKSKTLSKSDGNIKRAGHIDDHHGKPTRRLTKEDLMLPAELEKVLKAPNVEKLATLKLKRAESMGQFKSSSEPDLSKLHATSENKRGGVGRSLKGHFHGHHAHHGSLRGSIKGRSERGSMKKQYTQLSRGGSILGHPPREGSVVGVVAEETVVVESAPAVPVATLEDETEEGEEEEGSDEDSEVEWEGDCGERCVYPCLYLDRPEDPVCGADVSIFGSIGAIGAWINWILGFPFHYMFRNTIPFSKHYKSCFAGNVTWIIVLSLIMVVCVNKLGCLLGIGKFTMAFVVIAMGTSVPDTIASMLVARDGFADMAVSNAIGSNIFDINLGLGFPYLLSIAAGWKSQHYLDLAGCSADGNKKILQGGLYVKFGGILLIILVLQVIGFKISGFKLSKYLGAFFFLLYFVVAIYAVLSAFYCVEGTTC
jgi:K+-dependent Na+/Ca+ exchanger-like protein